MTGGLQEQVTDGKNWFGHGIQPAAKSVIGSLEVPYIYEDRISREDFFDALNKALRASKKAYQKMSVQGREHVRNNYNFDTFEKRWVELMDDIMERHGSWNTRNGYERWHLMEVA